MRARPARACGMPLQVGIPCAHGIAAADLLYLPQLDPVEWKKLVCHRRLQVAVNVESYEQSRLTAVSADLPCIPPERIVPLAAAGGKHRGPKRLARHLGADDAPAARASQRRRLNDAPRSASTFCCSRCGVAGHNRNNRSKYQGRSVLTAVRLFYLK